MSINKPMVNAGFNYINGLQLVYNTTLLLTVTAGSCRDSTNSNDISVGLAIPLAATQTGELPVDAATGNVTINTAANGVAGLDQCVLVLNTFYAVYAIGDSNNVNPGSAMLSANLTTPLMPHGYDMFFRIGYVKTDASVHLLAFRQDGIGLDRWMWYDAPIVTGVTAGASATYAAVDATGALPTGMATMVNWYCVFTPTAANNKLVLVPGTSTATLGYASASGAVGAVVETVNLICPTDLPITDAIDYKVTGSAVAIDVAAYLDQLSV